MKHFLHHLIRHAIRCGDAVALMTLVDDELRSIRWPQLLAQVIRVSRQIDVRFPLRTDSNSDSPRRWFGYESKNDIEQVVLSLAISAIGGVEIPIDCRGGDEYRDQCWNQIRGHWLDPSEFDEMLWSDTSIPLEHVAAFRDKVDSFRLDSPALVLFTSGSRGQPKGVLLSSRNLIGNANAKLSAVPQTVDDIRLTVLSYAHAYARTCDLGTWLLSGCTLVPALGHDGWERLAPRVRPTLVNTVPSFASRLLSDRSSATSRLRLLGCGGAAMSADEFQKWEARGVTVIQGYGMTETSPVICSATPEDATPGHVGHLVDGWDAKLIEGRLFVRGPHVMLGYLQPDVTAKLPVDADGWLDTGDFVEQDATTGQYRILGRADDLIVLDNGFNVHPATVEQRITALPFIQLAFLHSSAGELVLWVQCADEISQRDLENEIPQRLNDLPQWSRPKVIRKMPTSVSKSESMLTAKGVLKRDAMQAFVKTWSTQQ